MKNISRRQFFVQGASFVGSQFLFSRLGYAGSANPGHVVVIVTLTGGIDHSMFLPYYNEDKKLIPGVHFFNERSFSYYGKELFYDPLVFTPQHPLIDKYPLTFVEGIYMDGQNDHAGALSVLVRSNILEGSPSLAAFCGELLGQDTQHGVITFGQAPYHGAPGLSPKASGTVYPQSLGKVQEMIQNDFTLDGMDADFIDNEVSRLYEQQALKSLRFAIEEDKIQRELKQYRKYMNHITRDDKNALMAEFTLEKEIIEPYQNIEHVYGTYRHEPFAMISKLLKQGNFAGCYVVPLGSLEGFDGYDTHGSIDDPNDPKQRDMLRADLSALSIFQKQIEPYADRVTLIVQSEFGRTPLLNPAKGKDHWGFNNAFMIKSPLFPPGRFGSVNKEYGPNDILYTDGSYRPLTCRGFYKLFLERLKSQNLITAPEELVAGVFRQAFSGPFPKNLFALLIAFFLGFTNIAYAKTSLTPLDLIYKVSFALTAEPPPQVLIEKYQDADPSLNNQAIVESYKAAIWNEDEQQPNHGFVQWLIDYHSSVFKIKMPRNVGLCTFCWPKTKIFPNLLKENERYLRLFPDRMNTEYMWGGSDFEIPQSTLKIPYDYVYHLWELEPIILATTLVINHKPYSEVLTTSLTVRSPTLNQLTEAFPKAEKELESLPNFYRVEHWTGIWDVKERKEKYHSGILTTQGFLATYPKERTWANKAIYQNLMCENIHPIDNPHDFPIKFHKSVDAQPVLQDGCQGCHYMLDGLANLRNEFVSYTEKKLKRWSDEYIYPAHYSEVYQLPKEQDKFNEVTHHSSYSQFPMNHYFLTEDKLLTVDSMKSLGQKLSQSREFSQCVVKKIYERIHGKEAQPLWIEKMAHTFQSLHYDFEKLLLEILLDPTFKG
jgi:hypothetical protein